MTDRYTKSVLTVIAAALCILAVENVPMSKEARAQNYGPAHVVIDQVSSYAFSMVNPIAVRVAP